jgi:hypothetical protein
MLRIPPPASDAIVPGELTQNQLGGLFALLAHSLRGTSTGNGQLSAVEAYRLSLIGCAGMATSTGDVFTADTPGVDRIIRVASNPEHAQLEDFRFPDRQMLTLVGAAEQSHCGSFAFIEANVTGAGSTSLAHALHNHYRPNTATVIIDISRANNQNDLQELLFPQACDNPLKRAGHGTLILKGAERLGISPVILAQFLRVYGDRQTPCQVIFCARTSPETWITDKPMCQQFKQLYCNQPLVIPYLHNTPERLTNEVEATLGAIAKEHGYEFAGVSAEVHLLLLSREWYGGYRELTQILKQGISAAAVSPKPGTERRVLATLEDFLDILPEAREVLRARKENLVPPHFKGRAVNVFDGAPLPEIPRDDAEQRNGATLLAPPDSVAEVSPKDPGKLTDGAPEKPVPDPVDAAAADVAPPTPPTAPATLGDSTSITGPDTRFVDQTRALNRLVREWREIYLSPDDLTILQKLRARHDKLKPQVFLREVATLALISAHGDLDVTTTLRNVMKISAQTSLKVLAEHLNVAFGDLLKVAASIEADLPPAITSFEADTWHNFSKELRSNRNNNTLSRPWIGKPERRSYQALTALRAEEQKLAPVKEVITRSLAILKRIDPAGTKILDSQPLTHEEYDDALVVYTYLVAQGDITEAIRLRKASDMQGRLKAIAQKSVQASEIRSFFAGLTIIAERQGAANYLIPERRLTQEDSVRMRGMLEARTARLSQAAPHDTRAPAAPLSQAAVERIAVIRAQFIQSEEVLGKVRQSIKGEKPQTYPTVPEVESAILFRILAELDWTKCPNKKMGLAIARGRFGSMSDNGRLVALAAKLSISDENHLTDEFIASASENASDIRMKYPLCLGETYSERAPGNIAYRDLLDSYIAAVARAEGEREITDSTCSKLGISSPQATRERLAARVRR